MTSQVSIRFFQPAPALRHGITSYYVMRVDGEAPVEDLLHPEWPNIRLMLSGTWGVTFGDGRQSFTTGPAVMISGTLSRTAVARGGPGLFAGVGLLPAGWVQLSALSSMDFADDIRPLGDLVGPSAETLVAGLTSLTDDAAICAVLDDWFAAEFARRPPADPILTQAYQELMDPELSAVADWARRLGRSTRQLERLALEHFGMSPKRLLRRQRFLRTFAAIRELPPGSWGRLIDERYADQSHFVRDFQHFMGMSPRVYFARDFPFMRAVGDARRALLGAPVQGLHDAPAQS